MFEIVYPAGCVLFT